jgi:hypothetical protein
MVGFTQRRKKGFRSHKPEAAKLLRARITEYEQCRDAKCTPELIMVKELKKYSKLVKSKCGILPKNLNTTSDTKMRAHAKCTSKLYDVSRYHQMAKKQTRCVKKNCNHMKLFYPILKHNKK